jgi:hypothetical protein
VDVEVGDDVVNRKIVGGETVSFMKLDVEGYEPEVLTGLRHTISKYHPVIGIELNFYSSFENAEKAVLILKDYGYNSFFVLARKKRFENRYLDFIGRVLLGEEFYLSRTTEFSTDANYNQVFCACSSEDNPGNFLED